jgi:hypothetical protein
VMRCVSIPHEQVQSSLAFIPHSVRIRRL